MIGVVIGVASTQFTLWLAWVIGRLWNRGTMARALRIEFPDAVEHVTRRGMERRGIGRDEAERGR